MQNLNQVELEASQIKKNKERFLDRANAELKFTDHTYRLDKYDVEYFVLDEEGNAVELRLWDTSPLLAETNNEELLFDAFDDSTYDIYEQAIFSYGRNLDEFPFELSIFQTIQKVSTRELELEYFPENVVELDNLKTLDLGGAGIMEIPGKIGKLDQLEELLLFGNKLTDLPEGMSKLTNLKKLDLTQNNFRVFPEIVCELSSLEELILSNFTNSSRMNQLEELPNCIENLGQLRVLNLGWNQLKELPETIGGLSSLEIIRLGSNQLKELPETIGGLSSLEIIRLGSNQLKELPRSIKKLQSLQEISLANNKLTKFPYFLSDLQNLKILNLDNCQIKSFSNRILNFPDGIKITISLRDRRQDDQIFHSLFKLITDGFSNDQVKTNEKNSPKIFLRTVSNILYINRKVSENIENTDSELIIDYIKDNISEDGFIEIPIK